MLRHILDDLEWGLTLAIATLILLIIISLLNIQHAIANITEATITETDIAPGLIHCRAEQILTDEAGHKWEIMLFTNQVDAPQIPSLNLRLSGLSSSLRIQSQKPLVISSNSSNLTKTATESNRYEAANTFFGQPPLPSIGQYDLQDILPQLPKEELLLEIPLEKGKSSYLHIPQTMVKEWQEVAAKATNPSQTTEPTQELPSGFQLFC